MQYSLFLWHINLRVLFNANAIVGISIRKTEVVLKVNVIAWLEFELAYYNVAAQPLRHGNSPSLSLVSSQDIYIGFDTIPLTRLDNFERILYR